MLTRTDLAPLLPEPVARVVDQVCADTLAAEFGAHGQALEVSPAPSETGDGVSRRYRGSSSTSVRCRTGARRGSGAGEWPACASASARSSNCQKGSKADWSTPITEERCHARPALRRRVGSGRRHTLQPPGEQVEVFVDDKPGLDEGQSVPLVQRRGDRSVDPALPQLRPRPGGFPGWRAGPRFGPGPTRAVNRSPCQRLTRRRGEPSLTPERVKPAPVLESAE